MICKYGLVALFMIGSVRIVSAENAYSGLRLFHDASERSALEAGIANVPVFVEVPPAETNRTNDTYVRLPEKRAVSFNGIVIRHDRDGSGSAITWVDGKSDAPAAWQVRSLKGYEHRVNRLGQSLSLKLGQTRIVSRVTPMESR